MQFIFDLVGYLGAVVFVTVVMFYWVFLGGVVLLDLWVKKITNGDIASLLEDKLWGGFKSDVNIGVCVVSFFVSVVYSVVYSAAVITGTELADTAWLQGLQQVSIYLTPIFSYAVSVGVALLIINWLATKGYRLSKAVKKLEEKSK